MKSFALIILLSIAAFSQPAVNATVWKLKTVEFEGDTIIKHKYRVEFGVDSAFAKKTAVVKIKARNNGTLRIQDTTFRRIRYVPASEVEE